MSSIAEVSGVFRKTQLFLKQRLRGNIRAVELSQSIKDFNWHPAILGLRILLGDDGWFIKPLLYDAFQRRHIRLYPRENTTAVMNRGRLGWTEIEWQFDQFLKIRHNDLVRYDNTGRRQAILTESSLGVVESDTDTVKVITLYVPKGERFVEIRRRLNRLNGQNDDGQAYHMIITSNMFTRGKRDVIRQDVIMSQFDESFHHFLAQMTDLGKPFDPQLAVITLRSGLLSSKEVALRDETGLSH